ncbi:polymer-forming cytoskeletal protein [Endozoicomonas sp. SM1973]|uniref:Polymer-forming cytoskeletal protein n=1 Tax=Spartinivicinus marinus TaxID=2994442 RepID=A0A853IKU2_9GAMM|nr:polymer-forming cytoskeletal protein [Spartinivicinus marinus]MCX4028048.1 polymer-forming cytoskeletal protein [Spartinivicinus marinus]NYZ68326.1 polymer-forming cytoskeletal protein [Spartinivicinus marinus]
MWGKAKPKKISVEKHGHTTLIANCTSVAGDITFSGMLQVEGIIKGNVTSTEGEIRLAENGMIEGEIKAPNVVINGKVHGDVFASERLELASKALIEGNVFYNRVEMVMGAQVNGKLEHKANKVAERRKEKEKPVVASKKDQAVSSPALKQQAKAALESAG